MKTRIILLAVLFWIIISVGLVYVSKSYAQSGWSCEDPEIAQRVALDPGYFPGRQEPLGVVPDGAGGVYLLWDEYNGQLTERCRIQHLDAAGDWLWPAEGIVVQDTPYTDRPKLASDSAGGVFVAYGAPDAAWRLQRFDSAGNRLFGPKGIVLVECCFDYPWTDFISDGTGGVFFLWITWNAPQTIRVHHVNANGEQLWGGTSGVLGATSTTEVTNGVTAMLDGQGGLFFSYAERIPSDDNIRVQRLNAAGQRLWGPGGVLACGLPYDQTIVERLAADGQGGVLAFWFSRSGSGDYVGGQRLDGAGQPVWPGNGLQLTPFEFKATVTMSDGQGGAWISCWRFGADRDNYTQRVLPNGSTFFASPIPICVAQNRQYGADLNPDGEGGAFLTWLDWRHNGYFDQDIYFQHVRPNGEMVEPLNGSPVTTANGKQGLTRWWTGANSAGQVFVFWDGEDLGVADPTIFAERIPCGLTSVSNDDPGTPTMFALSQNYPNPFNPLTNIKFQIPKTGFVKLIVYDNLGREVATLVHEQLKPGTYEVEWDASNYPSGVYYYELQSGNHKETKKMVLVK